MSNSSNLSWARDISSESSFIFYPGLFFVLIPPGQDVHKKQRELEEEWNFSTSKNTPKRKKQLKSVAVNLGDVLGNIELGDQACMNIAATLPKKPRRRPKNSKKTRKNTSQKVKNSVQKKCKLQPRCWNTL